MILRARLLYFSVAALVGMIAAPVVIFSAGNYTAGHDEPLQSLRATHSAHEHENDLTAVEEMTESDRERQIAFMTSVGFLPSMHSPRGRELILEKGCIVCHYRRRNSKDF